MPRSDPFGWLALMGRAVVGGVATAVLLVILTLLFAPRATASEPEVGLRLYGITGEALGQAPQLRTDVSIKVTGLLARVRVEQHFSNPGDTWVEGVYVFPLPDDAAVDRLRMRYGGRLIEGEIQERAAARKTYEQARTRGQGASLLDQQRANIFTTSLANIPPGETVRVEIEYQQHVRWLGGEFSLRFPAVVGPRFIPGMPMKTEGGGFDVRGWSLDTGQVPDASRITPPVVANAGPGFNPLTIQADLDMGLELVDIASPYHPVETFERLPGSYRVTLTGGSVPAERDFVLQWRVAPRDQPAAALFTEVWAEHHYGMLMLMPPGAEAAPESIARELILVVDTSGSMHGDSISQARAALLRSLRQLRPGDRFNIIQFNSGLDALFDHAMPADHERLQQARDYVRGLRADGGTEMLPAMRRALDDDYRSGLLRQVVFLTDGAVGNEQALFAVVNRDIGDSRLFTVGIGSAPNALFMRRAAKFGRGSFTYIGGTDEVEEKIGALFQQLSAPVLTDVQVRWETAAGGETVEQAPERVPDLYVGEPLVLVARAGSALTRVRVSGRLSGRRWEHTVALHGGADAGGVHALWARRRIEDWMARLVIGEAADHVRDNVLLLALEHQLVSRYTSLVAVDRTPARPETAELESAALATRLPAGWSGVKVFGRLPGTATPAPLFLLLGLCSLVLAWLTARRRA